MDSRLLIVSNRLPITIQKRGSEFSVQDSVGGLATGLGSIYYTRHSLWIGWPGIIQKRQTQGDQETISEILKERMCLPVFLTESEYKKYYSGLCNKAIWPLFHYFYQYAEYEAANWKAYVQVNVKFCDTVCAVAQPGDIIWVHDYQLMLLPGMIREKIPGATIGFFLHIPFPPFELFRQIPWRKEILSGLTGADLIGFHTFEYLNYFLNNVRRILGYEHEIMQVKAGNRIVKVDTFPMGIDYHKFARATTRPQVKKEIKKIRKEIPKGKIILSIDRLDYTKGVPARLRAFDMLLEEHPELRESITFILVAVPSRVHIDQYAELKREVDYLVGKINGTYGTIRWTPVIYLYTFIPFNRLIAIYNLADLALITPLRDGMNLMAKEYLATKVDGSGMLVLSEFAGAAKELGEAILVNPNDIREFSSAIHEGLMLSDEEKKNRMHAMQHRIMRYDLNRWTTDFLEVLDKIKKFQEMLSATWIDKKTVTQICRDYKSSKSRVFFLDYDGTLVPIAKTPEMARPDPEIYEILNGIVQDHRNHVVIISGRDRQTLEAWFGSLPVGLISEHGIWIKDPGSEWEMNISVSKEWKTEIKPILEVYADRTPGSFVEEKEYSLAWHYRNSDPGLATIRVIELREDLILRTKNLNLNLLEGHKVFEIKNAEINKGIAVQRWLKNETFDFIFAAGDDRTDEDIFEVLASDAHTIKVGPNPSLAQFSIRSVEQMRELLKQCFCTGLTSRAR
jgi:trehalose 6-phosphate synthase/phosphatase